MFVVGERCVGALNVLILVDDYRLQVFSIVLKIMVLDIATVSDVRQLGSGSDMARIYNCTGQAHLTADCEVLMWPSLLNLVCCCGPCVSL